ncbi:MAG: hypothetical protein EBY28_27765, partial [Betaproteobacteria bacterium]|nr:hypothetical protein [Betaproteobacteria bacterium]
MNITSYKGQTARIEFDDRSNILVQYWDRVLNLNPRWLLAVLGPGLEFQPLWLLALGRQRDGA